MVNKFKRFMRNIGLTLLGGVAPIVLNAQDINLADSLTQAKIDSTMQTRSVMPQTVLTELGDDYLSYSDSALFYKNEAADHGFAYLALTKDSTDLSPSLQSTFNNNEAYKWVNMPDTLQLPDLDVFLNESVFNEFEFSALGNVTDKFGNLVVPDSVKLNTGNQIIKANVDSSGITFDQFIENSNEFPAEITVYKNTFNPLEINQLFNKGQNNFSGVMNKIMKDYAFDVEVINNENNSFAPTQLHVINDQDTILSRTSTGVPSTLMSWKGPIDADYTNLRLDVGGIPQENFSTQSLNIEAIADSIVPVNTSLDRLRSFGIYNVFIDSLSNPKEGLNVVFTYDGGTQEIVTDSAGLASFKLDTINVPSMLFSINQKNDAITPTNTSFTLEDKGLPVDTTITDMIFDHKYTHTVNLDAKSFFGENLPIEAELVKNDSVYAYVTDTVGLDDLSVLSFQSFEQTIDSIVLNVNALDARDFNSTSDTLTLIGDTERDIAQVLDETNHYDIQLKLNTADADVLFEAQDSTGGVIFSDSQSVGVDSSVVFNLDAINTPKIKSYLTITKPFHETISDSVDVVDFLGPFDLEKYYEVLANKFNISTNAIQSNNSNEVPYNLNILFDGNSIADTALNGQNVFSFRNPSDVANVDVNISAREGNFSTYTQNLDVAAFDTANVVANLDTLYNINSIFKFINQETGDSVPGYSFTINYNGNELVDTVSDGSGEFNFHGDFSEDVLDVLVTGTGQGHEDISQSYQVVDTADFDGTNFVELNANSVGVTDLDAMINDFKVYPVPTNDFLNSNIGDDFNGNYRIINSMGQVVQKGNYQGNPVSVSNLETGIYFMSITEGDKSAQVKFIKK